MRGSPERCCCDMPLPGIIPAHAGLTSIGSDSSWPGRDHPRACGAHQNLVDSMVLIKGSSPRMRGSHVLAEKCRANGGIIPAHAGLTNAKAACHAGSRDHPRACGAHTWSSCTKDVNRGSSPRMRGSLDMLDSIGYEIGIIPAHAGLTIEARLAFNSPRDHPRACGAHFLLSQTCDIIEGSSPRMRGSPSMSASSVQCNGIIPAHAGLTHPAVCLRGSRRDHPRACGAHMHCM